MSFNPLAIEESASKVIEKACENAIIRLSSENGVECADWKGIHTIAMIYLEEISRQLGVEARNNGGEAKLNLHQILTLGVNMREEEDAEKEGNMTVVLAAGPIMKQMIKNDAVTESGDD